MQQSIHVQASGALNSTSHYSSKPLHCSQVTECFVISPIDRPRLKCLIIKCFVEILFSFLFFFFNTATEAESIKWSEPLWACRPVYKRQRASIFLPAVNSAAKSLTSVSVYHHKKETRQSSRSSFSHYSSPFLKTPS